MSSVDGVDHHQPNEGAVVLRWDGLRYDLPGGRKFGCLGKLEGKSILHGLSGYARPGEVLAIMGATGAGKSTLLDILANLSKTGQVRGHVSIAEEHASSPDSAAAASHQPRKDVKTAYVTQEDHLMGSQTVEEALWFHANLRLPETLGFSEKRQRIESILRALGLMRVRHSLIGTPFKRGISGGEKKRVSVAVEMLTDPDVLFLDEPTTGLDAFSAYTVMQRIHLLAHRMHRVVVFTIHQPRPAIYALFDRVLLLDAGRTVYFGNASTMPSYFETLGYKMLPGANPADFALDVILSHTSPSFVEDDKAEGDVGAKMHPSTASSSQQDPEGALALASAAEVESAAPIAAYSFERVERKLGDGVDSNVDVNLADAYDRSELAQETARHAPRLYSLNRGGGGGHTESSHLLVGESSDPWIRRATSGIFRYLREDVYGTAYASFFLTQVAVLSLRNARNVLRTPTVSYVMLFQTLFNAFLCGLLYFDVGLSQQSVQNRVGALFFILVGQSFSTFQSLVLFLSERELFKRERSARVYRTTSYIMAKQLVDTPLSLLFPAIYATVVYWLIGFQADALRFGVFLATVCLFSFTSHSINLLVGALSPTITVAQIISPVINVVLMLGGGFLVNIDTLPLWFIWLKYVSYFRYGFFLAARNEFSGLVFDCDEGKTCAVHTGEQELELLGVSDFNYYEYFGILISFIIGLRMIAWVLLLVLHKERR